MQRDVTRELVLLLASGEVSRLRQVIQTTATMTVTMTEGIQLIVVLHRYGCLETGKVRVML
jgi:hypothetical protein